jgi:hypothetical protein
MIQWIYLKHAYITTSSACQAPDGKTEHAALTATRRDWGVNEVLKFDGQFGE